MYKGVFKGGGSGGLTPPLPEIFRFFGKCEGKEVEWVEKFLGGFEKFSGGVRSFRWG